MRGVWRGDGVTSRSMPKTAPPAVDGRFLALAWLALLVIFGVPTPAAAFDAFMAAFAASSSSINCLV